MTVKLSCFYYECLLNGRILVLDTGNVAEFDSPQNLLADSNSIFYSMAKTAGLLGGTTASP
jgi:hypothetical protein